MRFAFLTLAAATLLHAATGPALAQDVSGGVKSAGLRTMTKYRVLEPCARAFGCGENRIDPKQRARDFIERTQKYKESTTLEPPSDPKESETPYSPDEPCAHAYGCDKDSIELWRSRYGPLDDDSNNPMIGWHSRYNLHGLTNQ
jgi:hypothetical protein